MLFFSADLHLSHGKIQEYEPARPGTTVPEMNDMLIELWNETVGPKDDVLFLGDLAMGKVVESVPLSAGLQGRKYIFPGNHDRVWSHNPQREKFRSLYEDAGWVILGEQAETSVGGHKVLLCHFPYEGDSQDEDRYLKARPVDRGLPLLCGHVHSKWRERGRMLNVGVDVNDYRPISADVVVEWLDRIQEER